MIRRGFFSSRRSRPLAALVAAPLLAALAVSACSSSGSSSSAAGASSAAGTSAAGTGAASAAASGATGTPYVLGSIGSYTGPIAGDITVTEQIFQIWSDYVNANGGINGHPVKVISMDDGGNPATAVTDANKLVADHVLAIVGEESPLYPAWAPIFDKAGIPVIGGQNIATNFTTDPLWFPSSAGGLGDTYGVLAEMSKQDKTKLGVVYCSEAPDCAKSSQLWQAAIKVYNPVLPNKLSFVYSGAASSSAPDYSSQCLAAKQAGVNSLYMALPTATAVRVMQDCAAQGLKPLPVVGAQVATAAWATPGNIMSGVLSYEGTFPWTADNTPATQAFQAAIQKYDPSFVTTAGYSDAASELWVSTELFRAAAISGKLGNNPTAQDVVNAMYTLPKNYTVNGLTSTLNFIKGKPAPVVPCGFVTELQNAKYVAPDGSAAICPPAS